MSRAPAGYATMDLRSIARDPMLRLILAGPVALAAVARWGVPWLEGFVATRTATSLVAYRPLALGLLLPMVVPMLFGMLAGLRLLEDRDTGAVEVLAVTPVGAAGYLRYRAVTAGLAATLALALTLPISGMLEVSPALVVPAVVLGGLVAPVFALLFGALASDQLEGLAVMKGSTLVLLAPLLLGVVEGVWTAPLYLLPTGWPVLALWHAADGARLAWTTAAGMVVVGAWLVGAWRVARRRLGGA